VPARRSLAVVSLLALLVTACGGASAPASPGAAGGSAAPSQSQAAPGGSAAAGQSQGATSSSPAASAAAGSAAPSSSTGSTGGSATAVAIAAGSEASQTPTACAVLSDGTVGCWSWDGYGQKPPVYAAGISTAKSVAVGVNESCVLLADGSVRCWGGNEAGQLGNGTYGNSAVPLPVSGISGAVDVAVGAQEACATLSDGSVACWGANRSGQLGDGETGKLLNSALPVKVQGVSGAVAVGVGGNTDGEGDGAFACALLADGQVQCWGNLTWATGGSGPALETVKGISTAKDISIGGNTICGLLADATVDCWGLGVNNRATLPTPVTGLSGATSLSVGAGEACATRSSGDLVCWGYPQSPAKQAGVSGATAVAVTGGICVIATAGAISCNLTNDPAFAAVPLLAGQPVGSPVPMPPTVTIGWDGTACTLDAGGLGTAGAAYLLARSKTPVLVQLLAIGSGHSLADAATFFATYSGGALPAWLTKTGAAEANDPYFAAGIHHEWSAAALVPGTYAALCYDNGLAGYVLASNTLVVNP
jgi:Regulator of chromosome condensation (RCC1) repeat